MADWSQYAVKAAPTTTNKWSKYAVSSEPEMPSPTIPSINGPRLGSRNIFTQPSSIPAPQNESFTRSIWDSIWQPTWEGPSRLARNISSSSAMQGGDPRARFGRAAINFTGDALSSLTSPGSAALTAMSLGSGLAGRPLLGKAAQVIGSGAGLVSAGEQASEDNWGPAALNAALSIYGLKGLKGKAPVSEVLPTIEEAPTTTVIPGKRRLGPAPQILEQNRLLGPATNPEILPDIPMNPNDKGIYVWRGVAGSVEDVRQPRADYGFTTYSSSKPVADSYSSKEALPFTLQGKKVIEFPTKPTKGKGNEFDKFAFDKRAKQLADDEVLVARNVYDPGPRGNLAKDPERLFTYPSDIYAVRNPNLVFSGHSEIPTPRFIAGNRGVTEANGMYQPYSAELKDFGQLDEYAKGLPEYPTSRVTSDLAADYGAPAYNRNADAVHLKALEDLGYIQPNYRETYNGAIDPKTGSTYINDVSGIPVKGDKLPRNYTVEPPPIQQSPVNPSGGGVKTRIWSDKALSKEGINPEGEKSVREIASRISKLSQKGNPVAQAVENAPDILEEAIKRQSRVGKFKQFGRNVSRSIEAELESMGDAGRQIKLMLANASTTARQRASRWDAPYDKFVKAMNSDQQAEFWKVMDGKAVSTDKVVNAAVDQAKKVDIERTGFMNKAGVKNPETGEPFKPMDKYAPRIYPEGFWQNPKAVYDAIKQKYPAIDDELAKQIAAGKSNPEIVDRVMQSAGVNRKQAETIIGIGRAIGERKISSQFSRTLDLPGYRTDMNVWKEHNWDIARKTAEQEIFGQYDIGDPNSPLSKLVEQTPNPQYTRDLLKVALGREDKDRWTRNLEKVNSLAAKASSTLYLSLFPISNMANLITVPLQAGVKNTAQAILETIATNRGQTRAFASEAGALYNITKGILEHASSGPIAKGITWSENFNRAISANAGKMAVKDLFDTLKAGKLNAKNRKFLEDLTLSSVDDLMKQESLSAQQVRNAGGRMSELTQGIGEGRKVPVYWNNPYLQIPLIFRKYSFQQTGIMKDAIARDPKNILLLMGAAQLAGEGIGDAKAFLKGSVRAAVSGNPDRINQELSDRGSYLGQYLPTENKAVLRMADNMVQAWALGLVADLYFMSTGTAKDMVFNLAGPAIGTLATGAEALMNLTQEPPKGGNRTDMLFRESMRRIPLIGPGLQRELMPTNFQKKKDQQYR